MPKNTRVVKPPEMRIPLGTVVHDERGNEWVFVGYRTNTQSTLLYFANARTRSVYSSAFEFYHTVHRETMLKKFPDILQHEIVENDPAEN